MDKNSKRIAKNTIYLYIRMLFLMFISFFTTRIVLEKLGAHDYGIYNVVSSIAISFSFFSSSLTNASQRFLAVAIGKNDIDEGTKVMNQHLIVYGIICIIIILISELIGTWFISEKLNFSQDKLWVVQWVFRLSIISVIIGLISIVFNSMIIAHEDMKIYSYVSIFDGIMKLLIVYLLGIMPYEHLLVYALLMTLITFLSQLFLFIYCIKRYPECRFSWSWDIKLIKKTFSFISWNVLGSISATICDQGISILSNMFFGPIINAASGIATQVNGAIFRLSTNFLISLQPQMVKSYVQKENDYLRTLFFNSSRFSLYFLWIFVCPVFYGSDDILRFWLVDIPEWTNSFVRWALIISLIAILKQPIWMIIIASGKLKKYIIYSNIIMILLFPLVYILLKLGYPPVCIYMSSFIINVLCVVVALYVLNKFYLSFSLIEYLEQVIKPFLLVLFPSIASAILISSHLDYNIIHLFIQCLLIFIICIVSIYCIGLSANEKIIILNGLRKKFYHKI